MTPIEIIALVFSIAVLLKMLFFILHPKGLINLGKKVWGRKEMWNNPWTYFYLFTGIVIFYFLLQEIDVVTLSAAVFGTGCVMGLYFVAYPKVGMQLIKEFTKDPGRLWIIFVAIIVLAVAVLRQLFF